jgi:hypothetical protein
MGIFSRIEDWVTTPYTVYLILKDPAIPRPVKLRVVIPLALIFVYVVSPIDIIPDFIPFAGWLDDLVVVPLGLAVVRIITPGFDVLEKRERAQKSIRRILFWIALSLSVAILLGLLWLGLIVYIIIRLVTH